MNQEAMFRSALIGGVLLGVLSAIPVISVFNCFCCAWVIGGGILAANLYVKSSPSIVSLGHGVILGLMTGAIGAVVDTVFSIPLHLVLSRIGMGFADQLRQAIEQIPNVPPETREALRSVVAGGGRAGVLFIILGGFIKLVIYSLVAMLGGTIGVALFEKRKSDLASPKTYQPPTDLPPPLPPQYPPPPPDNPPE